MRSTSALDLALATLLLWGATAEPEPFAPALQQQSEYACFPGVVPCIPSNLLIPGSAYELLPTSGTPWTAVQTWSDRTLSTPPILNNPGGSDDMTVLAAALRWRRTGTVTYRTKVENALQAIIGTQDPNCEPWEIARNITGYVVAADVIDYVEPLFFEPWLEGLRDQDFDLDNPNPARHETFAEFSKRRPNNQGVACGLARLVIAMYLDHGNQTAENLNEVQDVKAVFHRWLGNTTLPDPGFDFGSCMAWIPPEDILNNTKRGINALDAEINTVDVDGVMPDDQRRIWECGSDPEDRGCDPICSGPTPECESVLDLDELQHRTNYAWETMQCIVMTAHFLDRCRYRPFTWEDQAIKRASDWLYDTNQFRPEESCDTPTFHVCQPPGPCLVDPYCPEGADCIDGTVNTGMGDAESNDAWIPFITDEYYSEARADHVHFEDGKPGKVFGFSSWWAQVL